MKKTTTHKLALAVITIRSLSLPQASNVRGGVAWRGYSCCPPPAGGDGIWCPPPDLDS